MATEDHHFLSSSLYSNGSLVAWDPAPFSCDLNEVTMLLPPHLYAILGSAANLVTEFLDSFSDFCKKKKATNLATFCADLHNCPELSIYFS